MTIINTTVSTNNQLGIYMLGPVINNLILNGVTIHNNGYEGIVIDNSAQVNNLSILGSTVSSSGQVTANRGIGLGISLTGTNVNGLTIVDSNFTNNRAQGMYFDRAAVSNTSFQNTNITGSIWDGIHIRGSASVNTFSITGGSISNNSGFGFISRSGTGGLPTITALTIDGVQFNGNNNSGLSLIGNLNGTNIIRNSTFYNSAWEDLDVGVSWLGTPTTINGSLLVASNTFQAPAAGRAWTSAYVESGNVGNANISFTQNCFNRTGTGLYNASGTTVLAQYNWWNNAGGPGAGGASVSGLVNFTPWSTTAGVCSLPTVLYTTNTIPADASVLTIGPTQITVEFNKDVLHDGLVDAANNPANYLLLENGTDNDYTTLSCASPDLVGDSPIPD